MPQVFFYTDGEAIANFIEMGDLFISAGKFLVTSPFIRIKSFQVKGLDATFVFQGEKTNPFTVNLGFDTEGLIGSLMERIANKNQVSYSSFPHLFGSALPIIPSPTIVRIDMSSFYNSILRGRNEYMEAQIPIDLPVYPMGAKQYTTWGSKILPTRIPVMDYVSMEEGPRQGTRRLGEVLYESAASISHLR
jgi:hypothetical protein